MNRTMDLSGNDQRDHDKSDQSDQHPERERLFEADDPAWIARELKRAAEQSAKKRVTPYRKAMSALVFYINRSNKNLPAEQLRILEQAKEELRTLFGKQQKSH
jgi:hypothetical protein